MLGGSVASRPLPAARCRYSCPYTGCKWNRPGSYQAGAQVARIFSRLHAQLRRRVDLERTPEAGCATSAVPLLSAIMMKASASFVPPGFAGETS
jgi:hypothetical protein